MTLVKSLVLSAALTAAAATAGAKANPGLAGEEDINAGLLVVAVADKIRRACPDISARFLTARSYITTLKSMASERGYSDGEIEAYINDDLEKEKMRMRRNAFFESRGASNLDPASLCALGKAEIQKQSQIGTLLRTK